MTTTTLTPFEEQVIAEVRAAGERYRATIAEAMSATQLGTIALTAREQEILGLLIAGKTNKQIAHQRVISENTVRAHVRNLMEKTGAANRTQLAVWGLRHDAKGTNVVE